MQFESRVKRRLWSDVLISIVPDVGIAAGAAYATDGGAPGFVAVLLGLWAVYFLVWLKNTVWSWLFLWAARRKRLAETFLDGLRRCRYPRPQEYYVDAEDYFASIATDEQQPVEVRMSAAVDGNLFNTMK